ncbi:spore germination protein GerPB [Aquibacillus kalidii]|uniref:spore germination protein GerPB n=1 Tax=Aquibacillus kalidii TaxID=2762597 RepID=UPI0016461E60|nr:spore germination protein GerPB [Aquibacillus kalidii]
MYFTVHQSINIHLLKVGSVSNSSVLQIGSAGSIEGESSLYNTGGFESLAEEADPPIGAEPPLVPLIPPS